MADDAILIAQAEEPAAAQNTAAGTETHAAEGHSEAFPPFDPNTFPSQLLWLAISFAALYFIMSKAALPRIGEILEIRRDRIESDLAEADRLRQRTDEAIAAYEEELAEARGKAHAIAEETRQKIKSEADEARAEVETDLAGKMAAAEASIQETKEAALSNVNQIAAETAAAMVGRIAGKVAIKDARDAVAQALKE